MRGGHRGSKNWTSFMDVPRFDLILVCEMILTMGHTPRILPQGQGILQLTVPEFNITFLAEINTFRLTKDHILATKRSNKFEVKITTIIL